jgi:hypothetical protein
VRVCNGCQHTVEFRCHVVPHDRAMVVSSPEHEHLPVSILDAINLLIDLRCGQFSGKALGQPAMNLVRLGLCVIPDILALRPVFVPGLDFL